MLRESSPRSQILSRRPGAARVAMGENHHLKWKSGKKMAKKRTPSNSARIKQGRPTWKKSPLLCADWLSLGRGPDSKKGESPPPKRHRNEDKEGDGKGLWVSKKKRKLFAASTQKDKRKGGA